VADGPLISAEMPSFEALKAHFSVACQNNTDQWNIGHQTIQKLTSYWDSEVALKAD